MAAGEGWEWVSSASGKSVSPREARDRAVERLSRAVEVLILEYDKARKRIVFGLDEQGRTLGEQQGENGVGGAAKGGDGEETRDEE